MILLLPVDVTAGASRELIGVLYRQDCLILQSDSGVSSALSFHILCRAEWGAARPPTKEPAVIMSNSGFHGCRTISQHLNDLKKENFSLKLRIYFLEEKIQQKFEESSDDVHKRVSEKETNCEKCMKSLKMLCVCVHLMHLCRDRPCSAVGLVVFRAAGLCLTVIHTDSRSQAALQQFIQAVSHNFLPARMTGTQRGCKLHFVSVLLEQTEQLLKASRPL